MPKKPTYGELKEKTSLLEKEIANLKRDRKNSEERLRFEKLASELSARFINMPASEIDRQIDAALQVIGEFLDAERCALAQPHPVKGGDIEVGVYHTWVSARLGPKFDANYPSKAPSGLREKLLDGEVCVLRQFNDIPEEWVELREWAIRAGVKSTVIVPLRAGGELVGSFAVESFTAERAWSEDVVQRLTHLADVFVNALARKRADKKLKQAFSEIKKLKDQLEADYTYLREEIKLQHNFDEIIGKSNVLKYVLYKVEKIAPTDTTVLILGETGVGKELVARAIHNASSRNKRPLVKVDCATLPPNLIESELFGHEKGAFTGAQSKQVGRFELADGSTILLDEIGELPQELQPKLLRVLQDGEFERLGSSRTIKVDVRVIAVTNRDLEEEVSNGRFRKDLWYRLSVFPITLPPLKERIEDIPLLVNSFVNKVTKKLGKEVKRIPDDALRALQNYHWPGNVRELENVIERAVISTEGSTLRLTDKLEPHQTAGWESSQEKSLEEVERDYIVKTLEKTNGRVDGPKGAARILRLNPATLRFRMRKLGIQRPPFKA